ncbi:MAG: GNAT family N-acetyltransferase [Hyphomicrobiales bacterium]
MAVIGASRRPGSVGAVLAQNLFKCGFQGSIMPVNPKHDSIEGVIAYPDVASLPIVPDLAVIATPPSTVPGLIAACAERGTKAAVVITAGFGEGKSKAGQELQQAMLDAAQPHLMRIIGPNCIGVIAPGVGLNASFAHLRPQAGHLAFVAQSGAIVTSVLDWAEPRGIGFSHLVSLGDMCDVDFGDMLDFLGGDADVRGILLFIEAVAHARKFMSAARAAARVKPVIVVKAGRSPAGAAAAASHTGALAGQDSVYEAAFRRAGMLRVYETSELFDAMETLSMGQSPKGDRLAILTNGGGMGVVATDALMDVGGHLAELSDKSIEGLDAVLPPTWSRRNPVDIIGDAPGERYATALNVLLEDNGIDAVLVLKCPTAVAPGTEAAQAIIDSLPGRRCCVLTSWLGDRTARESRKIFADRRIPTYDTPEQGVRAFMHMVDYRRNQEALTQTPESVPEAFEPDTKTAAALIEAALAENRKWLTEPEAKRLLTAYGIPVVPTGIARDPAEAASMAADLGCPVVLKILSPDITHKSDVRGVVFPLHAPAAVREAAETMLERVRASVPEARIDGFTVQPMVERPGAYELIVGIVEDKQFGPVILFGEGGTAVETIKDTAVALPPLNMPLAREAMARTRIYERLHGIRGHPQAALDEIALTLVKVSQLIVDFSEVVELDINPLLADEFGVMALDARAKAKRTSEHPAKRLAIRPYPKELEETLALRDGRTLLLRPVRPEDEPAFQDLFSHMSAQDIRMRFFAPKRMLSHAFAARMTQIDYDRDLALVLTEPGSPGKAKVYGVASIAADPDGEKAEYAIMLRSDMTGRGLGSLLTRRTIEHCRRRGIREIFGEVLRENKPMLRICKDFGFSTTASQDDPSTIEIRLRLCCEQAQADQRCSGPRA